MKLFPILCLFAAMLAAAPAYAEDGPTPAEIAKAKAATVSAHGLVDLFAQSCVAYAGNIKRLRVWLDAHATQANDQQTAYFLGGTAGKVWLQQSKTGNYAIVISDVLGICTVKAEKGPVSDVAAYIKSDGPRLKLALQQTGDPSDGSFMGRSGKITTYAMKSHGDDYIVVLVGNDKGGDPLQSELNLAEKGKDAK